MQSFYVLFELVSVDYLPHSQSCESPKNTMDNSIAHIPPPPLHAPLMVLEHEDTPKYFFAQDPLALGSAAPT